MIEATAATAMLVFFRGIQQQNVIHGKYLAAALTPFAIAAGEVATIGAIVAGGWDSVPWIGIGGAVGATSSMLIFRLSSNGQG